MTSFDIKFSIIFPSYNGESLVPNCLKSIENLDNINEVELIIIDNNSTDSTLEVIKSFLEHFGRNRFKTLLMRIVVENFAKEAKDKGDNFLEKFVQTLSSSTILWSITKSMKYLPIFAPLMSKSAFTCSR